jgi:hypothetical protein
MRYPRLYFALLLLLAAAHLHAQTAAAGAIVEGEVVNAATGAPIAGARVKLDPRHAEPLYLKSDAGGHFLFRNLPPALYQWSVEAPGFLQPAQPAFLDLTVPPAGPICVGPGGVRPSTGPSTIATDADGTTHARIAIPLTAYGVLTGKVTDPDGVPLEDWDVGILVKQVKQATPKTGNSGSFAQPLPDGHYEITRRTTVRTNDKGEFRAARLEPGTYYVIANRPSLPGTAESSYRATYYARAIDLASAKPLELAAGDRARADIRIVSQPGIRIAGRLVRPGAAEDSGDRLLSTQIVLAPETNLVNANGTSTVANDEYEFNDVLPGRYTLMAVTHETSDLFGGHQKAIFGLMRPIEAGDSDMNGVDLVLQPLRDLAGAVTFSEGCAPFPLTIRTDSFSTLSGGQAETVSGADGKFVLQGLGPGKFTVSVFSSSLMVGPVSIRLGERDVEKDGFESPISGDEPLLIEVGCANSRRPT